MMILPSIHGPHSGRRIVFFLAIFFLNGLLCNAQKITTFQESFGGVGNDAGMDALETADGGFITVGISNSLTTAGNDLIVYRSDSIGRHLWSKIFGGKGDEGAVAYYSSITYWASMIQADDSAYVICSSTNSAGVGASDIWLFKIDKWGHLLWSRTYGGNGDDAATKIISNDAGGFYITGLTKSFGMGNGDALLLNVNNYGDVIWMKAYGGADYDLGMNIKTLANGDLLMSGESYSYSAGNGDMMAARLDRNGNLLWMRTFGGSDWDLAFGSVELPDKSIYLCGQTQSFVTSTSGNNDADICILKLNGSGELLWSKHIGTENREGGVDIIYSGGFLYTTGFESQPSGLIFLKMDTSGAVNKMYTYSPQGYTHYIKRRTLDSGFYIYTGYYNGTDYDCYLLRLDKNGASNNCNRTAMFPWVTAFSITKAKPNAPTTEITDYKKGNFMTGDELAINLRMICPSFVSWFLWENTCKGQISQFYDSTWFGATSWKWDFGDTGSSSNTSTLRNPTHQYGRSGVYYVKLVVNNGRETDSVTRPVEFPTAHVSISAPPSACPGDSITLSVKGGLTYHWRPSQYFSDSLSSTVKAKFPGTMTYYVDVTFAGGCYHSDSVTVSSDTGHVFGPDMACVGDSITLQAEGGVAYRWSPSEYFSDSVSATTRALFRGETTYRVEIITPSGCSIFDTIRVRQNYSKVQCPALDPVLYMPNVFTPSDQNFLNDILAPITGNISGWQLDIYNRWGEHLFSGINTGWDGRFKGQFVEEGIYVYLLSAKGFNSNTIRLHGCVMVLPGR
jgi:hypothetical protein